MLKQFVTYLGVLLVVVSCGFGGPKKPKNLISKKNMVHILIDAKLLSTATFEHRNALETKGLRFNSYIFEKYGIVAYNIYDGKIKAKVLIYDYKDRKLKFSDYDNNKFIQIGAKSHVYFPEIKLIHENQVDMLRSLFEYKKS